MGQQKYFHDLKGIEDSTGTTHLFYRLYNHLNEDNDLGSESCIIWRNDVFHFDTQAETDSLRFESFQQYRCREFDTPVSSVEDYDFLDNDLSKWFALTFMHGIYGNSFGEIRAYNGSFYDALGFWGNKLEMVTSDSITYGVYDFWKSSIVNVLNNNDSLPSESYPRVILVKSRNDWDDYEEVCPNGEDEMCFFGKSDSLYIYGKSFLSIDQRRDHSIYFQRNDSLFWSGNLGKTMSFLDDIYDWSLMDTFLYGEADSTVIAVTRFKYSPLIDWFKNEYQIPEADEHQILRSFDSGNNWEEIRSDTAKFYVGQTIDKSGVFYVGNDFSVYKAINYGASFSDFLRLEDTITGLYKKPDSNLLYVLTQKELLKVNIETKKTTSLKTLPVSNETQSNYIPKQVTLNQNYPNPFNPTTEISYQLNQTSLVRLEVFDVTGRKVAILVNGERKSAGTYQVTFDAGNLASGVYFYRLETAGQVLTKKMLLLK